MIDTNIILNSLIKELKARSSQLGLTWTLRPATVDGVLSLNRVSATYDGDNTVMPMISLIGPPGVGDRVYAVFIPPAGNYIIGKITNTQIRQLTFIESDMLDTNQNLTVTPTTASGILISPTVYGNNAVYEAQVICDFDETAVGTTVGIGELYIDGVVESTGKQVLFEMTTANDRATVGQQWSGSLSAGSHTFELYVSKSAAAGTQRVTTPHTNLLVKIYE